MSVPEKAEVRSLVDKIRRVLDDPERVDDETYSRLQRDYSRVVDDVNTELRECDALLDSNQSNDAIQRAERSSLLEIVATLQFADREEWEETVAERELDPADSLLAAVATRLGRFYGPVQQREPLLRELRWHSLALSPLRDRLEILWRLRDSDSVPETWEKDIQEFEAARVVEIASEIAEADKSADVHKLVALHRELAKKPWSTKPDSQLVQQAKTSMAQHCARRAREKIPELLRRLRAAESAGVDEIETGRKITDLLEKQMKFAKLNANHEWHRDVAVATEWVHEYNQQEADEQIYKRLAGQLRHALYETPDQKPVPRRESLQRLENALNEYEGVPEELQSGLATTYEDIERQLTHVYRLRLAGLVAGVLMTGTLIYSILSWRNSSNELAQHATRLETIVAQQDFAVAEKYIEKLKESAPHVLDDPRISALVAENEQNVEQENSRRTKVTAEFFEIKQAIDAAESLTDSTRLTGRIQAIEPVCRGELELNELTSIEQLLGNKRQEIQASLDRAFNDRVEKLSQAYAAIDPKDPRALEEIQTQLQGLLSTPNVREEILRTPRQLMIRVNSQISDVMNSEGQARLLAEIPKVLGRLPEYQAALKRFAVAYPDSSRGLQFERVLRDDVELWKSIKDYNQFVKQWSATDFTTIAPADAGGLIETGEKFLADRPAFARRKLLQEILSYLKPVAARSPSAADNPDARLLEALNDRSISNLIMATRPYDGVRVYGHNEPKSMGAGQYSFTYFLDSSFTSDKNVNLDEVAFQKTGPAPQSKFASEAARELRGAKPEDWEELLLAFADRLNAATDMEPIIRFQLLRVVIASARQGSAILDPEFAKIFAEIKSLRLPSSLDVFDPNDKNAPRYRRQIEDILKRFPDTKSIRSRMLVKRAVMQKPDLGSPYEWVSWLRIENDKWTCDRKGQPKSLNGTLHIGGKLGSSSRFQKIGKLQAGQFIITTPGGANFVEGRLVYLTSEES